MIEVIGTIILIIALFVGLPFAILRLGDRIKDARRRRLNPAEKVASDRRAYEARILHPDWDFYERHLQRPLPPALRELYADRALIIMQGLDYSDNLHPGQI